MPPAPRGALHNLLNSSRLMGTPGHLLARCPAGPVAPFLAPQHRRLLLLHFFPRCSLDPAATPVATGVPPPALKSRRVHTASPVPSNTVQSDTLDEEKAKVNRLEILRSKLREEGIPCGSGKPGQYMHLLCPKCGGGDSKERSFSLFIREDGQLAMWSCFRAKCGWRGHLQASKFGKIAHSRRNGKPSNYRAISEEGLQLEPLCDEIVNWFSERMITAETLRRNGIMQRKYNNEIVIAFTYKRNGKLVSCKYRGSDKRFFQEKDTERIFYGLDDIKQATDVIIVEGEMDKLAMEEAGFRNCVSVPDGAPAQVSNKLPDKEEDTKYPYLWNCKEYLDKASRIILATDADKPGQALAEELARRIGKERCWRVTWPKKSELEVCKDANEVLMYLGPDALRKVIEDAELYPIRGLFRFSNYFDEIDSYYHLSHGYELGLTTGCSGVDELYKATTSSRL